MIVYHGSKNLFSTFDYGRIGTNGTNEGKGFYFTDNVKVANGYADSGFLYSVEFSGKKSLSSDNKTITKSQLRKYLAKLNKTTDYLSNWGDVNYSGITKILNEAVDGEYEGNDNDVDLICGICNASGNTETSLTLLYNMLGYDSIVLDADWGFQKLYIALTNDIIKIKKMDNLSENLLIAN